LDDTPATAQVSSQHLSNQGTNMTSCVANGVPICPTSKETVIATNILTSTFVQNDEDDSPSSTSVVENSRSLLANSSGEVDVNQDIHDKPEEGTALGCMQNISESRESNKLSQDIPVPNHVPVHVARPIPVPVANTKKVPSVRIASVPDARFVRVPTVSTRQAPFARRGPVSVNDAGATSSSVARPLPIPVARSNAVPLASTNQVPVVRPVQAPAASTHQVPVARPAPVHFAGPAPVSETSQVTTFAIPALTTRQSTTSRIGTDNVGVKRRYSQIPAPSLVTKGSKIPGPKSRDQADLASSTLSTWRSFSQAKSELRSQADITPTVRPAQTSLARPRGGPPGGLVCPAGLTRGFGSKLRPPATRLAPAMVSSVSGLGPPAALGRTNPQIRTVGAASSGLSKGVVTVFQSGRGKR